MKSYIEKVVQICVACLIFVLLTGCNEQLVYKTVGLEERYPVVNIDHVKLFERDETINQNYQLLGQVTINCTLGPVTISKKKAFIKLIEEAGLMGGDAIIDVHTGTGCATSLYSGSHISGLVVKWLESEEQRKPLDNPFVIARLPIMDPKQAGNPLVFKPSKFYFGAPLVDVAWTSNIVFKGYYVLPECTDFKGTIASAGVTGNLCSKDSQFLLKVEIQAIVDTNIVVAKGADYFVNVKLYDKASGETVLDTDNTGMYVFSKSETKSYLN